MGGADFLTFARNVLEDARTIEIAKTERNIFLKSVNINCCQESIFSDILRKLLIWSRFVECGME